MTGVATLAYPLRGRQSQLKFMTVLAQATVWLADQGCAALISTKGFQIHSNHLPLSESPFSRYLLRCAATSTGSVYNYIAPSLVMLYRRRARRCDPVSRRLSTIAKHQQRWSIPKTPAAVVFRNQYLR